MRVLLVVLLVVGLVGCGSETEPPSPFSESEAKPPTAAVPPTPPKSTQAKAENVVADTPQPKSDADPVSKPKSKSAPGSKSKTDKPPAQAAAEQKAVEGREPLTLKGHSEFVNSVSFSPDGKRIVSWGGEFNEPGEIKVWDAQTGQETLAITGHSSGVYSVSFSPNGRQIVSSGRGNSIRTTNRQQRQGQLNQDLGCPSTCRPWEDDD